MKNRTRLKVIAGIFFLQNSRNSRILDGLGFFCHLLPFFREISDDMESLKEISGRHSEYFNANPMIASYVSGAVMNLESRRKAGEDIPAERIKRVKEALSSVFTAKGDYFFEIVLMPFALTFGSIFAMYSSYIGPMIFLVIYNLYHLKLRIGGCRVGLLLGEDVGRGFATTLFREQKVMLGAGAFVSGVFSALVFTRAWSAGGSRFVLWGAIVALVLILLRGKIDVLWTVLALFLATAGFLVIV
ncbi:MAG: PTS system mannose/fructose/sorbose family transporter subunit IID [Candidatus Krumholzibacteriota bacterium]|nr:PTS system mannose/fructose/sorbose family transporter subunit IID [Candidatus Krumholzibacteriota bacterium]